MGMGEGEEADILGQLGRCVQTEGGRWVRDQRYSEVQLCLPSQVEMADCVRRKGEVERLIGLKVWDEFRSFAWFSQIPIMVVERFAESMYRGRRRRVGPKSVSMEGRRR